MNDDSRLDYTDIPVEQPCLIECWENDKCDGDHDCPIYREYYLKGNDE